MQQTSQTIKQTIRQTDKCNKQANSLKNERNKQTSAHTYTAHVDEDEQELQALVSDNMICTIWDQK